MEMRVNAVQPLAALETGVDVAIVIAAVQVLDVAEAQTDPMNECCDREREECIMDRFCQAKPE
jgi:hypothetical protein